MLPLTVMAEGDRRDAADAIPRAAVIAAKWAPDAASLEVWRYSANFVFTLTIDGVPHFLRVAPDSERDPERVAREIALLDWLSAAGWRVPLAVPAHDRRRIASETVGGQTYHAVLWPVVPGSSRELDELSLDEIAAWGAALGQLHAALRQAPATFMPRRIAWHAERDLIAASLPFWSPAVRAAAQRSLAWIAALPTVGHEYGLIHGDFELDNLLWTPEGLSVIDFDETGYSWFAADIGFAVRDLTGAGETVTSPRLAAFLEGYATARPMPPKLETELPHFSQWARLVTLARITRARAGETAILPTWAIDLDRRLAELESTYQDNVLEAIEAAPPA